MNYIGSKYSLLPFLEHSIQAVVESEGGAPPRTFTDLFAGTGQVGRHFKKKGYRIIANDVQYYSYVLNRHYIGNSTPLSFEGLEADIPAMAAACTKQDRADAVCAYLDDVAPQHGFVYHNYCKGDKAEREDRCLYFSDENGARCDAVRRKIEEWHVDGSVNDDEYFFLLATLIENIDKVANTASVYGAFLKKLKASARKPLRMTPAEQITSEQEHTVFNTDANRLNRAIDTDILYLDPPYNHRQYGANYHVLETIARYDNPVLRGRTRMRDYAAQKSAYCSAAHAAAAFADLIANTRARFVFLSYNNEGIMSFSQIRDIMSQRGRYGYFEQHYGRFKADKESAARNIKAAATTEYLHYMVTE